MKDIVVYATYTHSLLFSLISIAPPGSWKQRLLHFSVLCGETNQITVCGCYVGAGHLLADGPCLSHVVHSETIDLNV